MTDEARLCAHFGECGGCSAQDIAYARQLEGKARELRDLFRAFWDRPICVDPSPALWHYRNKVDFNFGRKWYPEPPPPGFCRESVLGFKARGRWYQPLAINECRIAPEGMPALLESVREWMRAQGLEAFDSRSKQGLLKILLVREGKRTGQRMVVLITGEGAFDTKSFVEAVRGAWPATSIHRGVFRGLADVAYAEQTELLDGAPSIDEILRVSGDTGPRELRFRLSPFSFFQTNTLAAEKLYGTIRQWVEEIGPEVLYDLYGGMGGIAFTCADRVRQAWSVESVTAAGADGRHNARINGIANVTFITERVKNYLRQLVADNGMEPDSAAIVDPPRAGMAPKALRRLVALRPAHVLYVSCNPKALARELPTLLTTYRLTNLHAIDLFPHTPHVELLASLVLAS